MLQLLTKLGIVLVLYTPIIKFIKYIFEIHLFNTYLKYICIKNGKEHKEGLFKFQVLQYFTTGTDKYRILNASNRLFTGMIT